MIKLIVQGSPIALKRHKHTKSGHTYDPSKGDKRLFLAKAIKTAERCQEASGPVEAADEELQRSGPLGLPPVCLQVRRERPSRRD